MSKLREAIQKGIDGKNVGLANGFHRINNYIFGLRRGCYMLLGGLSGTYKTTIVDFMLQNAIVDAE